jgi:hypothetical protein
MMDMDKVVSKGRNVGKTKKTFGNYRLSRLSRLRRLSRIRILHYKMYRFHALTYASSSTSYLLDSEETGVSSAIRESKLLDRQLKKLLWNI